MSELKLVKSEHFGEVEADIYSNGNDMFMTISQLADCLGYADKSGVEKIVQRNAYLKEVEFSGTDRLSVPNGKGFSEQQTRVFTEDGIYEVTMLSGQPKAKQFRRWIRGILKGLRTGKIQVPAENPLAKEIAEAKLNNSRARLSSQWLKLADRVDVPEFKHICASYAGNVLAGHEVLPLPVSGQRYMKAGEIGDMLGISANMVGKIAKAHGLKTDQYGKWFHDKSPHSNKEVDSFRYNDAAVHRFREILGVQEMTG